LKKKVEVGQTVLFFHPDFKGKIQGEVEKVYANGIIGVTVEGKKYGLHISSVQT
jgi:hypothetical protein